MTIKSIPLIYNVDKIRIYDDNLLKCERWYHDRHLIPDKFQTRKIESLSISVEGCLSEVVVLEIFLK